MPGNGSLVAALRHATGVTPFATGLNHPRWLYVLPNGDVLVAETNSPPKPDDAKGLKGKAMKSIQAKAGGSCGVTRVCRRVACVWAASKVWKEVKTAINSARLRTPDLA